MNATASATQLMEQNIPRLMMEVETPVRLIYLIILWTNRASVQTQPQNNLDYDVDIKLGSKILFVIFH